jgi:hypothetical protein
MAHDFINNLAEQSNISTDQAKKGLGAVLGFLQDKLPSDIFSRVTAAVPGAEGMMADADAPDEDSGGIVGKVTGAIGKLFGGSAGEMVGKLSSLGLSVDQVKSFLPNVLAFLKERLPGDVMKKISGLVPAPEEAAA